MTQLILHAVQVAVALCDGPPLATSEGRPLAPSLMTHHVFCAHVAHAEKLPVKKFKIVLAQDRLAPIDTLRDATAPILVDVLSVVRVRKVEVSAVRRGDELSNLKWVWKPRPCSVTLPAIAIAASARKKACRKGAI